MTKPSDPPPPTGDADTGARSFLAAQRALFEAATGLAGDALSAGLHSNAATLDAAKVAHGAAWEHALALFRTFEHRFGGNRSGEDGAPADGDAPHRLLSRLFDPKAWLTDRTGDAETGSPIAGTFEDVRRYERRVSAIAAAWIELQGRQLEQDALMLGAWTRAAQLFLARGEDRQEPSGVQTREAVERWLEIANRELLAEQRGEAFLAGQRRALKASTDLRLAQRALGDAMADMLGYPTRSEMDDVHRTITALRREVRDLRRQVDGQAEHSRVP